MKCSITDTGLRNISWALFPHMNSSSGVHPTKTRNSSPSSKDDIILLDQCIPVMGKPGLINPGAGSLPYGGSGRKNMALPALKNAPRSNPPALTCTPVISGGKPSGESLCLPQWAVTDKLHPGKSPENENRHQRSLFSGVLSTAANHEVLMVITEWEWGFLKWPVGSKCSWCTWWNPAPAEVFCSCIRQTCTQSKPYFRLLCSSRDNLRIRK